MTPSLKKIEHHRPTYQSSGQLLAFLTACFYALFTLLPDSHSLMVAWSWVLIWQLGLLCPVIWLLVFLVQQQCFPQLGNQLDWWVGFVVVGLIVSTVFAEFPNQARWYSWAALCFIAALYMVNSRLETPEHRYQLLELQGYLSIAFICISLILWTTQTLLPELDRLQALQQYGINLTFDFSVLELRNWAPIGHQNYVAGYLLLIIPLLVALGIIQSGWQRWVWAGGLGLGLIDLYTTSSRGGWLGLFVICIAGALILLLRSALPKLWLGIGSLVVFALLTLLVWANNRLLSLITAAFQGEVAGQLAYRLITTTTGWRMGVTHLFTGAGLGNVPLLYQQYRPDWAGYDAELIYQLHSTPAQLWAELGLWGFMAGLGAVVLYGYLCWRFFAKSTLDKNDVIFTGSILCAFLGYFVMSLTDYQLDNVAIGGILVIYLACIASTLRVPEFVDFKYARRTALIGFGVFLAVVIWLVPIHRAWQFSTQGFAVLNQEEPELNLFVRKLTQAHNLVPWEPYYSYQLGWNLGNLAFESTNPQHQQKLLTDGITWFKEAIAVSPYREFGTTNLGWLLLNQNAEGATAAFTQSAELVPAKRGVFYGLGLSLLAQDRTDLAVAAFTLEVLRDPLLITSPLWQSPPLQPVYPQVVETTIQSYTALLQAFPEPSTFATYLHQNRGSLYWWQGDLEAAREDLEEYGTPLSQSLLNFTTEQNLESVLRQIPDLAASQVISAWYQPAQRAELLKQAWINAKNEPIPEATLQDLVKTMEQSDSFNTWLKSNAPTWQYRRQRTGFGINSRHLGGAVPSDFFVIVENIPINVWFAGLFPSPHYYTQLDLSLQSQREDLLTSLNL